MVRLTLLFLHVLDRKARTVHLGFERHSDLLAAVQLEQEVPCQDSYHQDTRLGIYV